MVLSIWLVALIVAVLIGRRAPIWAQGTLLGIALVAPLLAVIRMRGADHLFLPSARGWAALALLALVAGFVIVIRHFLARQRAAQVRAAVAPSDKFTEVELDRYARHIVLREIGGPGQKALKNARVLVVGAGGLGAPALQYLAGAGVGTIGVIDADVVSNSNLQRQVIHRDADIGIAKVHSAARAMAALNPFIQVRPYARNFTADVAPELLEDYDLVLDGTDNFETRYAVNAACVAAGKPLISGALSQWEGQISLFAPALDAPCYRCIFPQAPADHLAPSCAQAGVLSALPGVIGTMMAVEAIKQITGAGQPLVRRLMIYDALYADVRTIKIAPRADCPICGTRHVEKLKEA